MGSVDEIPHDIREKARRVMHDAQYGEGYAYEGPDLIAKALWEERLAERQRCARRAYNALMDPTPHQSAR